MEKCLGSRTGLVLCSEAARASSRAPWSLLVGKDHCLSDPDKSAPSVSLKSSATFGRVQKVLQKKPGECAHRSANPSQVDLLGCALFLPTLRLILQLACFSLR